MDPTSNTTPTPTSTPTIQQTSGGVKRHWKDVAIERSEVISDSWEVTKIYCGRLAEWILYLCMIINVAGIFIQFGDTFNNAILAIQVVTLDIAGFGLQSMADAAKEKGNDEAAKKANGTGWLLISLMILTMLLVTIGFLFPPLKGYTDMADKLLILVRVVMTVIYGHVVHSLRHVDKNINIPELLATAQEVEGLKRLNVQKDEELKRLKELKDKELKELEEHVEKELKSKDKELQELEKHMANKFNSLEKLKSKELSEIEEKMSKELAEKELKIAELETNREQIVAQLEETHEQRIHALSQLEEAQEKERLAKQKITRKLSLKELDGYGYVPSEEKAKPKAKPELKAKTKEPMAKAKELKAKTETMAKEPMSSREKIKVVMLGLMAKGEKKTQQEIAILAGVGHSTVKLYYKEIALEIGLTEGRGKLHLVN